MGITLSRLITGVLLANAAVVAPAPVQSSALAPHAGIASTLAGGHPSAMCGRGNRPPSQSQFCSVLITGVKALTLDQRTGRVFVVRGEGGAGYVSVFDARSGALLRTVTVGQVPEAIAADAATGHV